MYKFYLPVGDWSDDGHGHCEKFLIRSNVPVEQVREAHYRIKDVTGIDIETVCAEYQKDTISREVLEKLKALEIPCECDPDEPVSVDDMAKLWLALLQKADPSMQLEILLDGTPMLPFYGDDEKGRHIGQVGYGLF